MQDLRSDHAGETGAVWIYRRILAVSRSPDVKKFAERHLETEQRHLAIMEDLLKEVDRSRLLGLWRVMGFITGAVPGVLGRRATFATIAAVETFVDQHYQEQVDRLIEHPELDDLRRVLIECQSDEIDHRDEALSLGAANPNPILQFWCALVGWGSANAVVLAKRV